ncbi:hypothetical protein Tco_1294886, partial [Tanacetum coccineum]
GRGGESFWEGGDDFRVDVLRFHTCLTDILGFLEKSEWWFEQDINKEEEIFEGDEDGGEVGGSRYRKRGTGYSLKDKNQPKTDKTKHEMEKREKVKVKVNPKGQQVKVKAESKEILNGLSRTHLMGRTSSFSSEIFKSLSFCLDRLCHLAILCLDQHAHTLHHLESLLTISLDRLDIFEGRSCISEFVRKSLSLILELYEFESDAL